MRISSPKFNTPLTTSHQFESHSFLILIPRILVLLYFYFILKRCVAKYRDRVINVMSRLLLITENGMLINIIEVLYAIIEPLGTSTVVTILPDHLAVFINSAVSYNIGMQPRHIW